MSLNLLKKILVSDPKKRLSWTELYDHEIFKKDIKQQKFNDYRLHVDL